VAVRHTKIGELGASFMGGVYNQHMEDGLVIDAKRRCDVFALDFNTTLPKLNTYLTTEWAWIFVEVPGTFTQQYGTKQQGGFLDIVQPVLKRSILGWEKAVVNIAVRLEYVDWNVGTFRETGGTIGDELWSIMPALSFRPVPQTVIRLNYRYMQETDLLNNPPALTGGFSFGVSSYF
jgi:hypothetical protein